MKYIRDERGIKQFGKRVKAQREKQGISQSQLAYEAGISQKQISRIEIGEINTGLSTVFAIARALDVLPKELFDF